MVRGTFALASSSMNTSDSIGPALRPPRSGGQPGTSQPASNIVRVQRRAQSGAWPVDTDGSAAISSGVGRLAASHSSSSARNASTASS